jgi:hypothetical protein
MTPISGLRTGDFRDHPYGQKERYPKSGPEKEEKVCGILFHVARVIEKKCELLRHVSAGIAQNECGNENDKKRK